MNKKQLIEALAPYPDHLPVKVLLSMVMMPDAKGEYQEVELDENEAIEAADVSNKGSYILIESK